MRKLQEALSRLGTAHLTTLIGPGTVALLELLGLRGLQPTSLAKLVAAVIGPEDLLFKKTRRSDLLDALTENDAERLCRLLGLTGKPDPWVSLKKMPYPRNSEAAQILCSFFGYSPPSEDHEVSLPPPSRRIKSNYPLFEHQIVACRDCFKHLSIGVRPRVLLHMPTGSGKTRTAMNIITHYFRDKLGASDTVVWLAHSEELCEQAAEEFEKAWVSIGNRDLDIYRLFGGASESLARVKGGMVIGGLQLLYSRSLSEQSAFMALGRSAKLIIMDEAHQAIAPTYSHILSLLTINPHTALLGLSATPGRSLLDANEDMKLAQFFNRKKVTLEVSGYENPVDFLVAEEYLAEVEYIPVPYRPGDTFTLTDLESKALARELDLPTSVVARLGQDEKRNFIIISKILEEARKATKMLVFACSVEHAELIASILVAKGLKAAAVTSKTDSNRRRMLIREYKGEGGCQILCNYGVLTTGFDAPKTDCAVIARPTQSVVLYSQMVGRASRGPKAGGGKKSRVITVVDQIPGFRSVAEAFTFFEEIWE